MPSLFAWCTQFLAPWWGITKRMAALASSIPSRRKKPKRIPAGQSRTSFERALRRTRFRRFKRRYRACLSRSGSHCFRRGSRHRIRGRIIVAAPIVTAAGEPMPAIASYRIYRSEIHPPATASPPQELPVGRPESHAALLAASESNSYRDTSFVFERTYVYTVRSVIQVEGKELESSDSQPVTVTPRDIFPPAARKASSPRCFRARLQARFLLISPGASILKPIWPDIASIEVSRKASGDNLLRPNYCPLLRFVIRL